MTINYNCVTEKDFETFLFGSLAGRKVAESTVIAGNSWAWSQNYQAAHINDTSNADKAAVQIPIGMLKSGDFLKITVEFMNISGTKAKLAVDNTTGLLQETVVSNSFSVESRRTGEFEIINLNHTVLNDGFYAVVAGTFRSDVSEFYIRDLKVEVVSGVNQPTRNFYKLRKEIKAVNIYSNAVGTFAREGNYGDDLVTIVNDSVNKKITVNWNVPFAGNRRPIVIAGSDAYMNSRNYFIRTQSATNEKVDIYIFDVATNTLQDPSTLPTNIFFNIIAIGYENY